MLFLKKLKMLCELRGKRRSYKNEDIEDHDHYPSIFPLVIPLIAGLGAIALIISLTNEISENTWQVIGVFSVMLAIILAVLALFMMAGIIEPVLGKSGVSVVNRF